MEIVGMNWRGKTSILDRVASLTAITIVAAGSVSAANAGTETAQSQSAAPAVPAPEKSSVVPAPDQSADTAPQSDMAAAKPLRASGHVRAGGSLQHRVDVLSKALQLDARQRTELLTILESQRRAVSNIWSDPKLLPAERTPATRALQERTADQIRAILSEAQKNRYNPPKPQGGEPPPNVEDWMRKQTQTQARQQQ
jgi:hypothetical protein